MLPTRDKTTICFAHVAYQLQARFTARNTGVASFEVRSPEELRGRVAEADVLVISGLWRDDLIEHAAKLHFIQAIGAGTDQFGRAALEQRGIRLASARGVNAQAVA
ncbi:MAG: D-2-hydroxyacid dehydrogenase, partial [Stellaceae bacterium]